MSEKKSTKPFIFACIGNVIIAASKFVAAALSGSSALIAEGIHSVVDAANNLLMLLGIKRSERPAGPEHPFGHGKELYFWTLIVAVVLFGIGGGLSAYEGIAHIMHPEPIKKPVWSYVVLGIAFVVDAATLIYAYREFRRHKRDRGIWETIRATKDPTKFMVVLEDSAATVGVLFAVAGFTATLLTGSPIYDGAASIAIGVLLATVALIAAREAHALLVGESMSPDKLQHIRKLLTEDPTIRCVHKLMSMQLGPQETLLNLDVEFERDLSLDQVACAMERLEKKIKDAHPDVKHIFIEARRIGGAHIGDLAAATA